MARLFSYCIPVDDGAAPNPFWGLCTLVICKPRIRRAATPGDWVVGTGSRRSPVGDVSGCVVYAMRVSKKLTMPDYDIFAHEHCPEKIPRWSDPDPRRRLGDAIYDFGHRPPRVRESVHSSANRSRDLSGSYALLSDHFFYFGDQPQRLPKNLHRIAREAQGHQSRANDGLLEPFLEWLYGLELKPNRLYGAPQVRLFVDAEFSSGQVGVCRAHRCSTPRLRDGLLRVNASSSASARRCQ